MSAIRAVTDELTFVGSHEVDAGYSIYPKGSRRGPEVDAQQNRLRRNYGQLMNPSPRFVEQELLRLFRAEADSVEFKKLTPTEPCKIDLLSAADLRVLKKDLKQRIHEWEGSFRRDTGKEAGPQDKLPLRRVYEAYKETKGRLSLIDGGVAPAPTVATQPPPSAVAPRPSSGGPPIGSRPNPPPPPRDAAPPTSIRARTMEVPVSGSNSLNVSTGSKGTVASNPSSARGGVPTSGSIHQATSAAVPGVPRPTSASSTAGRLGPAGPPVSQGTTTSNGGFRPLTQMSDDDIKAEKRKLKRELHSFENGFRERHGREPRREDREEVVQQYHRYAQLKAALNE